MNKDTSAKVSIHQVEQGMRTLTHDWRNALNGINLRISSAQVAEEVEDRQADLAEAQQLIVSATAQLTALSRKLAAPSVVPIPYPTEYFLEDVSVILGRQAETEGDKIKWENAPSDGKVTVDIIAISQALSELIGNTLRYLAMHGTILIRTWTEDGFLTLSWSEKFMGNPPSKDWGAVPFLTTERGHLGLGLYYAQRVLLAHRGTLRFEFSASAQTLETTLRIPLEIV